MAKEIKRDNPTTKRKLERKGRVYATRGGTIRDQKMRSVNLEEVNFQSEDVDVGLVGQFVLAENPFSLSGGGFTQRVEFVGIGIGGLAMTSDMTPTITGVYNLGFPSRRWQGIYLTNSPNVSSDVRLKQNVQPLDKGLEEVRGIETISYVRDKKKRLGFSAQNLQEVLPDVVDEGEDGYLSITPDEIVPVLVKSVQELSAKVDELQTQVDKISKQAS